VSVTKYLGCPACAEAIVCSIARQKNLASLLCLYLLVVRGVLVMRQNNKLKVLCSGQREQRAEDCTHEIVAAMPSPASLLMVS